MFQKLKKFLFSGILIGAGLGLFTRAVARNSQVQPAHGDGSYDAIDVYIEEQMRRLRIPGLSLAVVEGDKLVHFRGFGRARPDGEVPAPQTPFFIGSVTKSITALAIMQLVEAGKVELDAPIQRYLPWFHVDDAKASSRMTVRHLLNHTSGLSVVQGQVILTDMDDDPNATESQLRALSTLKLSRPVGTKFQYNNTNYNILGLIIEVASGEAYTDYVRNHIFEPLEMRHTYTSKSEAGKNGLAMGHRYWFGYPIPTPDLPIPSGSLPSGQIISCAEDMSHYLIAQLNGGRYGDVQILSSAGIEEMHRGTAEIIEMGMFLGTYAMGWESQVTGKSTIVWHSGIVPDSGACAGLVPAQKKGLILLYNANHAIIKLAFDEFGLGATQLLAGEAPSESLLGWLPWLARGMVLIPVFQIADVLLTHRRLSRWRTHPAERPSRGRLWGKHILLPSIPNLLIALTLIPVLSQMRGWIQLFMPDFSWIGRICGGFAAIWTFLRAGLILKTIQKPRL